MSQRRVEPFAADCRDSGEASRTAASLAADRKHCARVGSCTHCARKAIIARTDILALDTTSAQHGSDERSKADGYVVFDLLDVESGVRG